MTNKNAYLRYHAALEKNSRYILLLCFLLFAAVFVALSRGASALSMADTFTSLFTDNGVAHAIVWELRLPRIAMAALVGAGLGLSGTVFQAVLRNPLASPYTLGIGAGAGFGAVVAIVLWAGPAPTLLVAGSAVFFTLVSAFLILAVAKMRRATSETMILSGIALMFLFSSMTSFLQYIATMEQVQETVFWFFGSLSKAGWPEIALAAAMILLPAPFLFRMSWDFNLLAAGDESAKALGVRVDRLRLLATALASLITAGAVCFCGVIGFVGLVAPHITRMIIGGDHRYLFPCTALVGAVLVLSADTLGRTLWAPQVVPIGIVTALVGVPFFFYLVIKRRRDYW